MKGIFGQTFKVLEAALHVRGKRNEVLAANISNLETPGYRAKDIPFQEVMARYLENGKEGGLRVTQAGHIPDPRRAAYVTMGPGSGSLSEGCMISDLTPRERGTPNSVDLDREMGELALNNLQFQSTVQSLIKELDMLRTAITEGGKV